MSHYAVGKAIEYYNDQTHSFSKIWLHILDIKYGHFVFHEDFYAESIDGLTDTAIRLTRVHYSK